MNIRLIYQKLKKVDDKKSPIEWIVSVSMLTEGWDVKNVFSNKFLGKTVLLIQNY